MEDLDDVFLELPLEILLMLPSYLSGAEVLYLSHVSSYLRQIVNQSGLLKYYLSTDASFEYYKNEAFRQKFQYKYVCIFLNDRKDFVDLRPLSSAQEVKIRKCPLVVDVRPLKNAKSVSIEHCDRILDIISLGNVKQLRIQGNSIYHHARGFSYLHNVVDLDLEFQKLVNSDLIYLKNCKRIRLKDCFLLTSVAPLANVNTLELYCEKVIDLEALLNVKNLSLHLSGINAIDFYNDRNCIRTLLKSKVQSLQYNGYDLLTSVECLRGIEKLSFHACKNLENLSALSDSNCVSLSACSSISDVSMLGNVFDLVIKDCTGVKNWGPRTQPSIPTSSTDANHYRFGIIQYVCSTCQKVGLIKTCERCRKVYYCDSKCQRSHWKTHKLVCETAK